MPDTTTISRVDLADRVDLLGAILARVSRAVSWQDADYFATIVERERERINLERAAHMRPRFDGPLF